MTKPTPSQLDAWAKGLGYPDKHKVALVVRDEHSRVDMFGETYPSDVTNEILGIIDAQSGWHPVPTEWPQQKTDQQFFNEMLGKYFTDKQQLIISELVGLIERLEKRVEELEKPKLDEDKIVMSNGTIKLL